jgi:Tetratricopeptide repeat
MTGSGWMLLAVGLLCGGALGYTLRGAVGPREEGGMPSGPADVMSGMSGASVEGGGAGTSATGGAPGAMPEAVVQAVGEYRRRLAEDPGDVEANIGMGNLLFDSQKWDQAVEHYQRALDKTPGNADVRVDMAIAYHQQGQNQRAREEMERVTRESPEHRNAWLNLGVVNAAMGDNARAVQSWQQYLKLEPNGPHAAAIRAQIEDLKRGS